MSRKLRAGRAFTPTWSNVRELPGSAALGALSIMVVVNSTGEEKVKGNK